MTIQILSKIMNIRSPNAKNEILPPSQRHETPTNLPSLGNPKPEKKKKMKKKRKKSQSHEGRCFAFSNTNRISQLIPRVETVVGW